MFSQLLGGLIFFSCGPPGRNENNLRPPWYQLLFVTPGAWMLVCFPREYICLEFGVTLLSLWKETGIKAGMQQKPQPLLQGEVSSMPSSSPTPHVQGNEFSFLGAIWLEPCFLGHLCLDLSAEHRWPFYTLFCKTCTSTKIRLDTVHEKMHPFTGKVREACVWEQFVGFCFPLWNVSHCTVHPRVAEGRALYSLAAKTTTNDNFPFCHLSAPLLGRQFIFLP